MGDTATVKIFVIIVNWERPADTIACIHSVQAGVQPQLLAGILVVDNGSTDDSISRIRRACPGVQLLELPRNSGFSGGYNAGIRAALTGPATHFFILNNDTIVDPAALPLLAGAGWDIAVPKILFDEQRERIWAAGARWRPFPPSVVMRGYGRLDAPRYDHPQPLSYATGCALLASRLVLERLGGFDETMVSYFEDYDFSFRAQAAGFSMGYVPAARVYHKVSLSLGEGSPRKNWFLGRNTVLFYRKDGRFPAWQLWTFIAWVTVREFLKGHLRILPHFWKGVRDGLVTLHNHNNDE